MIKLSKRMLMTKDMIHPSIQYDVIEAINLLKKMPLVKFIESVDVAINLGIDTKKSDQNIRGCVTMPHGIGRDIFLVVFTQGENVGFSREAGADLVGLEDIFDEVKLRKRNKLDIVLASPDVMHIVSKLGSFLGPRGLMPNLKMGTVVQDMVSAIKNFKSGCIKYRNDKNGVVHSTIGKINFSSVFLKENLAVLIKSVQQFKPTQCKGVYIKNVILSTTMGRSICIDLNSVT